MTYLEPLLPLLLSVGVVGLVRSWRRSIPGQRPVALACSLIGILLISSNWVACGLAVPLEGGYSHNPIPAAPADAIVVLAGSVDPVTTMQPYMSVRIDTYRRLLHGVWLFEHWRPLPILVCGGRSGENLEPASESMRRFLLAGGIPPDAIWTEGRSHSTHENAVYGAAVLREHGVSRIVLVVEASGMRRAAASFEKAGIHVVPAPIRFAGLDGSVTDVLPAWGPLARNGETLHEALGLIWYRLRGWI
jgi:uncharacterized SAM-binding protein YcdF (DUF218 family)